MYSIAAFYKFVTLDDLEAYQKRIHQICVVQELQGTILLAKEGINGTVAGPKEGIDALLAQVRELPPFTDLVSKHAVASEAPFRRMKVRVKSEIVTYKQDNVDPTKQVGIYVKPEDWNALISDPDVIVVDTRNDYEVQLGTFRRAINPSTDGFTEFPDYVDKNLDPNRDKKIAMFCTGGIRCEKATSDMVSRGFKEVFHLHGGILKYLEVIPEEESLWDGECYVFGQRVSVKRKVEEGSFKMCHACGAPVSVAQSKHPQFKPGVSCPSCFDEMSEEQKARFDARQQQFDLAKGRES